MVIVEAAAERDPGELIEEGIEVGILVRARKQYRDDTQVSVGGLMDESALDLLGMPRAVAANSDEDGNRLNVADHLPELGHPRFAGHEVPLVVPGVQTGVDEVRRDLPYGIFVVAVVAEEYIGHRDTPHMVFVFNSL